MKLTSSKKAETNIIRQRLSRADIEGLCILNAISNDACTPKELAHRLDLSVHLAPVLVDALQDLASTGWLKANENGTYTVTDDGRAWTNEKLSSAGLL